MQVFGVVGPDSTAAVERLVARLEGRVAVLRNVEPDGGLVRDRVADTTCEVGDDGVRVTGREQSVEDLLDDLARDHHYAVLDDVAARAPVVAVGCQVEDALARADSAADLDVDAVAAAVDDLEPRETLASLVARAKRSPEAERSGAVATFTGRVRARDAPDDDPTEFLEFETYEGVAEERMDAIAAELTDRDGVFEVLMHHRTGVVEYGEDIVFVVVLAGHRAEAFRAVEDGIDRLKEDVPIFKKEVTTSETFWVHDRE
ncbi:MAG: molybdopterin synthase [Haloarculaceae archaeon]